MSLSLKWWLPLYTVHTPFWLSSPDKVSTKDLKEIIFEVMDNIVEIL